jgi:hypothetical protein
MLALSGVVFAVLFLVGWFASGGDAPDYGATDLEWTSWTDDNQWKSRIGAFAMLLAGFVFLHFAATIRTALGTAETTVRRFYGARSDQLCWCHNGHGGHDDGDCHDLGRDNGGGRRESPRDSRHRARLGRTFLALCDGIRCVSPARRACDAS